MESQSIQEKPKNIPHECLVAVDENGHALLIKSEPSLFENGVFDGYFLEDSITDKKNMPFECGIYKCKIMVYAYSYFTGDTTEHDMNVWCEDVVKLNEWISVQEKIPEIGERVLVFCKSQGIQMCYRGYHNSDISWMMAYDMSKAELNITHWMPLPELPSA